MATQIQLRRDTAANWTSSNPVLAQAEPGYETDTGKIKYGDGSTAWNSLAYAESDQQFSSGSASSPSITFTGDTNTGIYSPGADQLALSTNSSERIRIGANGEIGLGGANYGTSGQVLTSAGSGAAPTWQTPAAGAGDKIEEGNTSAEVIDTGSDGRFVVTTEGTERLRVTDTGLVGIGTSSPGRTFHVSGTTDTPAQFQTSQANLYINLANSSASNGYIGFEGTNLSLWNGGASRLNITSSGNVGIGTTSPGATFHARSGSSGGSAYVLSTAVIEGSTYGFLDLKGTGACGINFGDAASAQAGVVEYDHGSNFMRFVVNGAEAARIDSSRRLLVGTSSSSSEGTAVLQGNSNSSLGGPVLWMQRGQDAASTASGDVLGRIRFANNASNIYAAIEAFADAAGGSNDYPGRLVFSTTADGASSPTARMELKNDGRIRLFSDANQSINLCSVKGANTSDLFFVGKHSATGFDSGTNAIIVYTNGNVVNANNSYGSLSDIKLKENIVDANSQWNDLKALQVRNYNFKEGQTHTQLGLIAQEVELVSPGLVSESPDRDEDGNDLGTVTKSVNYSVLYMKAVKALQEAMERIETLEAKVAALESA